MLPSDSTAQSQGTTRSGATLPKLGNSDSFQSHASLKKWTMDKVQKRRSCQLTSVSFVYTQQFGYTGIGLAPCGLVPSDPVWHIQIWCFVHEFKMTSYIQAPNL